MRPSRRPGAGSALLLLLLAVACVQMPLALQPPPMRYWPATLDSAQKAATAGDYATADSALAGFASRFEDSRQAAEARFWRAVFQLDPQNDQGSPQLAAQLLDQYLGSEQADAHRAEATVMRHIAGQLLALDRALGEARAASAEAKAEARSGRSRADEAQHLRDELQAARDQLAKANDELDRIKKRLAAPKP